MIKYQTNYHNITAFEVELETEKYVIVAPHNEFGGHRFREKKVGEWINWHDTWEQAHAFLIAQVEGEVATLRMRLERVKGELGQIKGMKRSTG